MSSSDSERINKFLARCGLGSRRACEDLVRDARVQLDGEIVTELSTQVHPDQEVRVDGKLVKAAETLTIAYYKPVGLLCSQGDPQGRETIYDALPARLHQLHYAGRLDKESEGLLILTSDGELSSKITHPRHEIEKEYLVTLSSAFDPRQLAALLEGIRLEDDFGRSQLARAHDAEILSPRRLRLVLKQGLKRQIRAMMAALGYRVKRLVRVRIGKLNLKQLKEGRWRTLGAQDLEALTSAGSPTPRQGSNKRDTQARASRRSGAKFRAREQAQKEADGNARSRRHPSKRPTRNSFVKNRKAGAKRWKRH